MTAASIAAAGPVRNDQGDGVRAVARAVLGEARGRVALGVDGDRDQVKVGAEVLRAPADLLHALAQQRAGLLAGREDEVGDPDLARELARAEGATGLVGERERRQRREHDGRDAELPPHRTHERHAEEQAARERPEQRPGDEARDQPAARGRTRGRRRGGTVGSGRHAPVDI